MTIRKASLKQKIVLILGILFVLNHLANGIYAFTQGGPLDYIISTRIQHISMAAAMTFAVFRKKTPALALTILALLLCLVNQYVLTYGGVDPFYRTLYYMLEYILLIVYALVGVDRKSSSLLWCGLFLFSVGYSVYEVSKVLSIRDLVFLLHYLALYLVGYSPDRWYERSSRPQDA